MNVFCRIFGHTWLPVTEAPEPQWNTTKEGHVLTASSKSDDVQHYQECKRCGERQADSAGRFDRDGLEAPAEPTS
ncbi:MAG: hypothetical protein ACI8QS_000868 [Planctomycetota bacterium]|jgi:hypothetical protein